MQAVVSHYDELGDGVFRKVRDPLGVEAFGVNVMVFPPGLEGRRHLHDTQDELYFVHAGTPEIEIDGVWHALRPGSLAHVPAACVRQLVNRGPDAAVILAVGGKGGYVERDGRMPDGGAAPGREA
jgi:uncharacterized cupin superfamily protein